MSRLICLLLSLLFLLSCSPDKRRGDAKYKLKDYAGAIKDYDKAIENDPADAKAFCLRGAAKQRLNDYDGAIIDCSKAIQIDPDLAEAYCERLRALLFSVKNKKNASYQTKNS